MFILVVANTLFVARQPQSGYCFKSPKKKTQSLYILKKNYIRLQNINVIAIGEMHFFNVLFRITE